MAYYGQPPGNQTATVPSLTLKGLPADLLRRLRARAAADRRSLTQEAIHLLDEALADERPAFADAYGAFLDRRGDAALRDADLDGLRDPAPGRPVDVA